MGEGHGGPQDSYHGRVLHLVKHRKVVQNIFLERIKAGSLDVGHMTISDAVKAKFVDNPDGLQLMRVVGSCVGSSLGKTWLAKQLGTDEIELGLSATTTDRGGPDFPRGPASSSAADDVPVKQGCQVSYKHYGRVFQPPTVMETRPANITAAFLMERILGRPGCPGQRVDPGWKNDAPDCLLARGPGRHR